MHIFLFLVQIHHAFFRDEALGQARKAHRLALREILIISLFTCWTFFLYCGSTQCKETYIDLLTNVDQMLTLRALIVDTNNLT